MSMDMNMNDYNNMTTLPKRGFKTRSYNMNMNKKDLKRLSKMQLIKLLLKQEAKKPSDSINKHAEIIKPISRKSVNEDLIL